MKPKSSKKKKEYNLPTAIQNIVEGGDPSLRAYAEYFNSESGKAIRSKLVELLESKARASSVKSEKQTKYEMPSWSQYQADAIGYRRSCRELIELLK
jgi:hypothetical protein